MRTICADPLMPSRATVLRWLGGGEHPEFEAIHARAREAQADHLADELLEIADTPITGQKVTSKEWGDEITEADMIEHRKLRVGTRQWIIERMNPKKYGAKQQVDIGNADGKPFAVSDAEAAPKLAAIIAAGLARKAADASDLV